MDEEQRTGPQSLARGERGERGAPGPAPEVWKEIAIALAAVLFAVGGSWFAFGRNAVTQAQVRNLIAADSPYVLDKGRIDAELAQLDKEVMALQLSTTADGYQAGLERERIARIQAQVEQLLKRSK